MSNPAVRHGIIKRYIHIYLLYSKFPPTAWCLHGRRCCVLIWVLGLGIPIRQKSETGTSRTQLSCRVYHSTYRRCSMTMDSKEFREAAISSIDESQKPTSPFPTSPTNTQLTTYQAQSSTTMTTSASGMLSRVLSRATCESCFRARLPRRASRGPTYNRT